MPQLIHSHKSKRLELELQKLNCKSKRFDAEFESKWAEQQQAMLFHREVMELKKKEIDVQHRSLQLYLTQHQEEAGGLGAKS